MKQDTRCAVKLNAGRQTITDDGKPMQKCLMCDIKRKTLQQVFEDYFLPRIKETIFCDLKKIGVYLHMYENN